MLTRGFDSQFSSLIRDGLHAPEVQQTCRAIARLLMGVAGPQEARRTVLAVLIAATGERTDSAPLSNGR